MGFFRTLAIIILAFFGVRLVRRLLRIGSEPPDPTRSARTLEGADMVKDPACGIYIPRETAITAHLKGEIHHFCSEKCKETFMSDRQSKQ